ncbi:hypothetical protein PG993_006286 [Apiospora rasikravindrae]|uniref:Uncharacterized protein n=1 Tax=Apiospora rasikravindrae TaxID=990691 RepID=A0ABR1T7R6_9PEZI
MTVRTKRRVRGQQRLLANFTCKPSIVTVTCGDALGQPSRFRREPSTIWHKEILYKYRDVSRIENNFSSSSASASSAFHSIFNTLNHYYNTHSSSLTNNHHNNPSEFLTLLSPLPTTITTTSFLGTTPPTFKMQSFNMIAAFAAMFAMVSGQTFTAGQAITVAGQTVTLPTAITVSGFNLSTISAGNVAVPTLSL